MVMMVMLVAVSKLANMMMHELVEMIDFANMNEDGWERWKEDSWKGRKQFVCHDDTVTV